MKGPEGPEDRPLADIIEGPSSPTIGNARDTGTPMREAPVPLPLHVSHLARDDGEWCSRCSAQRGTIESIRVCKLATLWDASDLEQPPGLESKRLPVDNDVLAVLDGTQQDKRSGASRAPGPPPPVALAAIVERLLRRRNDKWGDDVRLAFTGEVLKIARRLVENGSATWKTVEGCPAIVRHVDEQVVAELALRCGEDPEQAVYEATGRAPRYRQGPCLFWKMADDGPIMRVIVEHGSVAGPPGWAEVTDLATMATDGLRTWNGVVIVSAALTVQAKKVPEYLARRLEQDGWIPYWSELPPAWSKKIEAPPDGMVHVLHEDVDGALVTGPAGGTKVEVNVTVGGDPAEASKAIEAALLHVALGKLTDPERGQ